MKLNEIATVTDINLARAARNVRTIAKDAEAYETIEQAANRAYSVLYAWLDEQSSKSMKLPGFADYDDLAAYLLGDIGVPTRTLGWREWFDRLPNDDKAKVKMIIHHGPRLLKIVQTMIDAIQQFEQKWMKEFEKVPSQKARAEVFDASYETKAGYVDTAEAIKMLINLQSVLIP